MTQQLPIQLSPAMMNAIASRIPEFCQRWKIAKFYFFGSVLRDDFRPDSDIDVMVQFEADATWGLLEFVQMKRELKTLLGREVDLVTKQSIEQSFNWIRRQEFLDTAQVVYVAGYCQSWGLDISLMDINLVKEVIIIEQQKNGKTWLKFSQIAQLCKTTYGLDITKDFFI